MGSGQWQGTEGFKRGNLKRQLESIPLFFLNSGIGAVASGNPKTARVWLTGLNGNLKVLIACGVQAPAFNSLPLVYPPNPGTLQLYPTTKFGDAYKVFMRPVFQDPTNVLNVNAPLPQQIPFGWEASFTETDEVMIEVIVDPGHWGGTTIDGTITVQATVEYNGSWWDQEAFTYVMGQVQLTGAPQPLTIGTAGG